MPMDDLDDGYLGAIYFMQLDSTSTTSTTAHDPPKQPKNHQDQTSNLEKLKSIDKPLPVYHMRPESTDLPIYDAKLNLSTLAQAIIDGGMTAIYVNEWIIQQLGALKD